MRKLFVLFALLMLATACSPKQIVTGDVARDAPVKEFTMTAKNWEFDPSTITVNKGDKVVIHITSTDVDHGFILPDFGVNVKLKPGETSDAVFIADKTGTFDFHCNVFCGSGHREMDGQLIVK